MNISPTQLQSDLAGFYGTVEWHKWSILFPRYLLTDGAQYLAEKAGAYWLMDLIASWQRKQAVRANPFQVWTLTVRNRKGRVVCEDGNGEKLAVQRIEYTDFPLDEIKLYAVHEDGHMIILLPSEY